MDEFNHVKEKIIIKILVQMEKKTQVNIFYIDMIYFSQSCNIFFKNCRLLKNRRCVVVVNEVPYQAIFLCFELLDLNHFIRIFIYKVIV